MGPAATRTLPIVLGLAGVARPAFALTAIISPNFASAALAGSVALGLVGGVVARVMKLSVWAGLASSAAIAALIAFGQHFVFRAFADDVQFFDEVSATLAAAGAYTRLAVECGVVLAVACFVGYLLARRWRP